MLPSASEINYLGCPDFSEVAVCVDAVMVSRVNSCHRAPSQSDKATPEVAEDPDTASQAPAATHNPSAGIAFHTEM